MFTCPCGEFLMVMGPGAAAHEADFIRRHANCPKPDDDVIDAESWEVVPELEEGSS